MNNLEKLIRYILLNYPDINELSKPRLVKLIYLIDWKYTINTHRQNTNIRWYFNHYGPYVNDVINLMKSKPNIFKVESYMNSYDGVTDKFLLIDRSEISLDKNLKDIANLFIGYTSNLTWSEFINLVYSSFPIKNSIRYTYLDLVKFSYEFKRKREEQ